jgi:hypothetical protein
MLKNIMPIGSSGRAAEEEPDAAGDEGVTDEPGVARRPGGEPVELRDDDGKRSDGAARTPPWCPRAPTTRVAGWCFRGSLDKEVQRPGAGNLGRPVAVRDEGLDGQRPDA